MKYVIKGYLLTGDNKMEKRFECITSDFKDAIEFLSRVSLEAYDRVTLLPEDYKEI